ncbi:hypothetical protein JMJ35_004999 [Cladonia borealis]|uniref:NAD(P)-binding protein n=1 Tax=Cladonia borealis TaxID=184061 RepID=A0AA39V282_9LECA|nr:hypothetical protein JMJ35_004999 [Cladonia borealis]
MAAFGVNSTGHEVVQAFRTHMVGKIVLITGPSKDGIGAEIAKTLASGDPDHLLLAGRNEAKITPVIREIQKTNSNIKVTYVQCDLLDNGSVRKAAVRVNSLVHKIDILINNAGIMAARTFRKSADGVESQFAAGYLGHFLLTNLIMDTIVAAKGVVVNMTSSAYMFDEVDTHDTNFAEGRDYDPWKAYARTKTANVLFTIALAKQFGGKGVKSFAVDPGMVVGTNLMANTGVDDELMKQGMDMAVARNGDTSLEGKSPAYVKECGIIPTLPYASDEAIAKKLWQLSERLVGQTFDG